MTNDLKNRIRTYWQERADAFNDIASHRREAEAWERVLTLAVSALPRRSRVLDLGAGTGACTLPIARLGHHVTAVDLASAMLAQLERQALAEGLEVSTLTADIEDLPMPERSLDLVTMRNLLWTLPKPEELLLKVHRALRPGGMLLIADGFWDHQVGESAPDDAHWSHKRFTELYNPIAEELPLYRGVSTAAIEQLIMAAGFGAFRHWTEHFDRSPYVGVTNDFFLLTASIDAVNGERHAPA
ncbi:MAG: class I SAM-dependent methyltransferase [Pseudomonadota bacterium]